MMKAVRSPLTPIPILLLVALLCPAILRAQAVLTESVNVANASPGDAVTYLFNYSNPTSNSNCSDTFETDTLGAFPVGWTASAGTWTLIADNGPTTAGTLALQGVAAANVYPYLLNNCGTQVGDGYIQSDMKIANAGTQDGVLLFRFNGTSRTNGSNYQALLNVGNTNNVSVDYWNNPGAAFNTVATGSAAIAANTWFTAKFEAKGPGPVTLSLWINGVLVVSGTTAFAIGSGQGGLQSNNGSTVAFDNVSIVKYPPLYNATLVDTLPTGLTYSSASGFPAVTGQQVVWTLGNLAAGANGALTLVGTVNNCGLNLVNQGELNGTTPLNSVSSNSVTTTLAGCSPTPTQSFTPTTTPTFTATRTPNLTVTPTGTFTQTATSSYMATVTSTPTATSTGTSTSTFTGTFTATNSLTATSTGTKTATFTTTFTSTVTSTQTATWSSTSSATGTPTSTNISTPTSTSSSTATATSTETNSFTTTATPTRTCTFTATLTPTFTATAANTATSTNSPTTTSTFTATASSTQMPTSTPTSTGTPPSTATCTATFTSTSTPTFTTTNTASTTSTNTTTFTSTSSPTSTSTDTATPTQTPTISCTSTATATPTATFTFTATSTPTTTATSTATVSSTSTASFTTTATHTTTGTATATDSTTFAPASTSTSTFTFTPTPTSFNTATVTPSFTSTVTDTFTFTSTYSATNTATSTASFTVTDSSTITPTQTLTPILTASMTSTATATHTAVNTPTHTKTHTFTQTSTTTPTSTATLTATNASTVNFTPTTTYTPVFTTTFTATVSSNLTSTSTPTRSITPTMTSIPSLSPTGVPNCLNESVNIFDASGELVRQLCGTGIFPSQNLLLTFGAYQPVPGGKGGSLPILLNGVVVAVWDSTDQQGKLVTNGFYQIEIVQVPAPPNSTVVTGDVYIDPNHTLSPIQLSASPNLSRDGTVVVFRSQIQGLPAGPGNEPLRIFTLTGDLVKTLDWQNGQTAWNLTNMPGETVASGLYLASEEASDALSGVKIHKTVKVVILR